MEVMDQRELQQNYGFLIGVWKVGRVIGWAISLEEMKKKTKGVYPREV